MTLKKKIVITGGTGRFGNKLKSITTKHKLFFPTKKQLNILKVNSIIKYFEKTKPDVVIHLAGFSRPMELHEKDIIKSINLKQRNARALQSCFRSQLCSFKLYKILRLVFFSMFYQKGQLSIICQFYSVICLALIGVKIIVVSPYIFIVIKLTARVVIDYFFSLK